MEMEVYAGEYFCPGPAQICHCVWLPYYFHNLEASARHAVLLVTLIDNSLIKMKMKHFRKP